MALLSGTSNAVFKTSKSNDEFKKLVEDSLDNNIGSVDISDKGLLRVNAKRFDNFACKALIEGAIKEKEGKFIIKLDYSVQLTTLAWVLFFIFLWFYGFGLLFLIFPFVTKSEMEKKVERCFDNIRFEIS